MASDKLKVYENQLWNLLNDGSKLAVITLLMEEGFEGEVKLIGVIEGDTTVIKTVGGGKDLTLPIDILTILNA